MKLEAHIGKMVKKAALLAFFILGSMLANSQNITVGTYSACPNQPATVTITWNNVAGATYFLTSPASGQPATGSLGSATTFTIACGLQTNTCINFVVSGNGTYNNAPITSSATIQLCIYPPAALTITNNIYYCPGDNIVFTAPLGGTSYDIAGPFNQTGFSSNIISFGPATVGHNGVYTVTSIGSCTATGTTTVSVAPNTPLTVNGASNVCLGGTVALSASMASGINFQWYGSQSQPLGAGGPNFTINPVSANDGGTLVAKADLPWPSTLVSNSVACPRTASTIINVVVTNPVSAAASPGGILCQGDKLSFSAVSGGAIGWSWSGPLAFAASISNPTINPVAPANAGNYTVVALFTNNVITCSTSAVVGVQVVTVNQPVISMPTSTCQNTNINVSATAIGAKAFNWFGPNNFSPSTGASSISTVPIQTIQPNASGIYYVTAVFGINTTTCASSSSTQLNVVPVNSITVIPPAQVCQPSNGNLQASAIGANSYTWVGVGGYNAPGPNAIVYYPTPANSGIYTVTASFNGGNITCYNTNTAQLTVNPVLTFSLIPRQQVCYNTPLGVTGPNGATSYTWTSSNGYTSNNKDLNFPSVQPKDAGTYTLNISLGPCVTTGSTIIDVLTPIQFTLVPQSRSLCKGDTTVLEAGVTGGSQNYAYTWNPYLFMDTPSGPKKVTVPLGSVIYNVIAHDISCPNFTIASSFSVTVNQPPTPNLVLDRTGGCVPLCLFFNSKTQSNSAITTYDFGGSRKMQRDSFNYCLDVPGTYSLTIYTKGKNGCGGIFPFQYPLVVFPKPESSITWSPENPTTTDEIIFSSNYKNGPLLTKQWSFSGGVPTVIDTSIDILPGFDTSNVDNPSRKYETLGKYPIMLISKNDKECTDTIVRFLVVTDDFKLYLPNTFTPNGDGINDYYGVKGTGIRLENFSMEIMDRWGNSLFFTKDITEWWDGKYKGNAVIDGTYIYKIKVVGLNGEGRKEFLGYFSVLK